MPRPFFEGDSLMLVATQGNEFRPVGDLTIAAQTLPDPQFRDALDVELAIGERD
jgi:hypothetical protein